MGSQCISLVHNLQLSLIMYACMYWVKKVQVMFWLHFRVCVFLLLAEFGSLSTLTRVAILHTGEFRHVVKCAILSAPIGWEGCYVLSDWFKMPPLQNFTIWQNSTLLRIAPLFFSFFHSFSHKTDMLCNSFCCFFLCTATFILIWKLYRNIHAH